MQGFVAYIEGHDKPIETITEFQRLKSLDHTLDVRIELPNGGTRLIKGCILFPRAELPACLRPQGMSELVFVKFSRQLLHARLNLGYMVELHAFGWKDVCEAKQDPRAAGSELPNMFREYLGKGYCKQTHQRLLNVLGAILAERRSETELVA